MERPQNLTISATEDPEDPGTPWPQWLELEGQTIPLPVTLPCKGCGQSPRIDAVIDGTGLAPGTYPATIVFRSEESGTPPYEIWRDVYLDHCREVFEDPALPDLGIVLEPGDPPYERVLNVVPTGGTIVTDVDVITDFDNLNADFQDLDWQISLRSPDGNSVFLKQQQDDAVRDVWDDETSRPASGGLVNFDGLPSVGAWTLKIENLEASPGALEFDMQRFHVRLHHLGAPACM